MENKWGGSVGIAAAYLGSIVGAGFASGQELIQFFVSFGHMGLYGSVLAGVSLGIWGALISKIAQATGTKNYGDFLVMLVGNRGALWLDIILSFNLFGGLAVMMAGSGAIFKENLGLNFILGVAVTVFCILGVLLFRTDGFLNLNKILIPFLVIVALLVGLLSVPTAGFNTEVYQLGSKVLVSKSWLWAVCLYISYNAVLGMVVLCSLGDVPASPLGVFWAGSVLGILALIMSRALLRYFPDVLNYDVPMLFLAQKLHPFFNWAYAAALWMAMLTTAVANAFGLARRLASLFGEGYIKVSIWIILAVLPVSYLGFKFLVSVIYPLLGYLGFFLVAAVFYRVFKSKHLSWKK